MLRNVVVAFLSTLLGLAPTFASEPIDAGYRDFSFGPLANTNPTREKPESKLWFNDGVWWGSLWNPLADRFEIHRFRSADQDWTSTGTALDERRPSKADVLWDGEHLYVVSHMFSTIAGPASPENSGRLYRFGYDRSNQTYTLDPGFPVLINASISETLVLDKDSTGRLWVCWVEAGRVWVNCTSGNDSLWGLPFELPGQVVSTSSDDIASLIAFNGDRIGIMWSNEVEQRNRFAIHLDWDPPEVWQPSESVSPDTTYPYLSDDHINLKTLGGYVYAVTKTEVQGGPEPQILLNRRDPDGQWTYYLVGARTFDHTRPILLLDAEQQIAHVLATTTVAGRSWIVLKSASLSTLLFPHGRGQPFIDSAVDSGINNVTSTKQNLTSSMGLMALASDPTTRHYFHNFLATPPTAGIEGAWSAARMQVVRLGPPRPSPFRESTELSFALERSTRVVLDVFDLAGRKVRGLVDGELSAGEHSRRWDGRGQSGQPVSAGIYFARLRVEGTEEWQRLVRIR